MLKEISIEIIRKCPNNCMHCSSMSNKDCSEILEYEKFVSVVDDAFKLGAKTICLSGGEPFLHPRIIDMIIYVYTLNLNCYVYTSGIIFDLGMNYISLSKDLLTPIAGKVSKLIFNIEAATSSTYDIIMGTTGCFQLMQQSVVLANSLSIVTEAHFVPMKLNIGEIEKAVVLCKELGISKISFLRLVFHGRAQVNESKLALSNEELLYLKGQLEKIHDVNDIDIRIGVPLSGESVCQKCEAANGKLNIKYDGKVFPCEVFKNERVSKCMNGMHPESIHDKSLLDIYNGSSYLNIVRELSKKFACGGHFETCVGQYLIGNEGGCDEQ